MKVRLLGVMVITLALLAGFGAPAWSQDASVKDAASQDAVSQDAASQDTVSQDAALQIEDAVVCQEIVDRAPVGSGDVFAKESGKIYCFTRVVGAAEDTQITHNWYHQGSLKASVKLNVRSSNWRTWSSKAILPELTGEWMVEILSEDGQPMESIIFFMK